MVNTFLQMRKAQQQQQMKPSTSKEGMGDVREAVFLLYSAKFEM